MARFPKSGQPDLPALLQEIHGVVPFENGTPFMLLECGVIA